MVAPGEVTARIVARIATETALLRLATASNPVTAHEIHSHIVSMLKNIDEIATEDIAVSRAMLRARLRVNTTVLATKLQLAIAEQPYPLSEQPLKVWKIMQETVNGLTSGRS